MLCVCRSVAGCRGADIAEGCQRLSAALCSLPHHDAAAVTSTTDTSLGSSATGAGAAAAVASKFFALSPTDAVGPWLQQWMACGGVCVATLNFQLLSRGADAWHHQVLATLE